MAGRHTDLSQASEAKPNQLFPPSREGGLPLPTNNRVFSENVSSEPYFLPLEEVNSLPLMILVCLRTS